MRRVTRRGRSTAIYRIVSAEDYLAGVDPFATAETVAEAGKGGVMAPAQGARLRRAAGVAPVHALRLRRAASAAALTGAVGTVGVVVGLARTSHGHDPAPGAREIAARSARPAVRRSSLPRTLPDRPPSFPNRPPSLPSRLPSRVSRAHGGPMGGSAWRSAWRTRPGAAGRSRSWSRSVGALHMASMAVRGAVRVPATATSVATAAPSDAAAVTSASATPARGAAQVATAQAVTAEGQASSPSAPASNSARVEFGFER